MDISMTLPWSYVIEFVSCTDELEVWSGTLLNSSGKDDSPDSNGSPPGHSTTHMHLTSGLVSQVVLDGSFSDDVLSRANRFTETAIAREAFVDLSLLGIATLTSECRFLLHFFCISANQLQSKLRSVQIREQVSPMGNIRHWDATVQIL